jgi:hypothetical protein
VIWADVAIPGAFVVGILAGGIGVIRIFKYALEYLKGQPPEGDEREASSK